ncbi:hypothetical protein CDL15_Pgr013114 [Punica granatum]|uniref:DUF6817 domain-containing protein n=1 Tax=Punica granatum TaxID=22663 RepID=A0A218WJ25_PUNGR|nr:hypothetical protein CDL15_Pgr013114 [Punica granatum]
MPSSSSLSQLPPAAADGDEHYLPTLLETARPFLRGELEKVDPALPSLVAVLRSVGAGECWHKHGNFLDHLVDIYRILRIWGAPDAVCLCGLFHSAYSNSYVNLAIFDPNTGRDVVRGHVGAAAERLIHLFCVVPRQPLIHDDLLFHYEDESELLGHLAASEDSLKAAREKGIFHPEEPWRKKINSLLPPQGVTVKHIKTGEDVAVSRRVVAVFLVMTMADFSDQLFGFQDELFENSNGRLEFSGNNFAETLWPGDGKPGLWMNSISRMGAVYMLIAREEEIFMEQKKRGNSDINREDEDIELVIPPVFQWCTRVLGPQEHIEARDLYWEAVCGTYSSKKGANSDRLGIAEELLLRSIEKNPFVGEPHVVLAQVYLGRGRFEEAEREAERGLRMMLEWGSPWDKRTSWEGWVAWARVLLMKAKERSWPQTSWGILNLGLVR